MLSPPDLTYFSATMENGHPGAREPAIQANFAALHARSASVPRWQKCPYVCFRFRVSGIDITFDDIEM